MAMRDKNIASLSFLRIAATLGVILMHVSSTLLDNPDLFTLTRSETFFHEFAAKSMYWCVPCFLMISGALLLREDKQIDIRTCVFKYARRLLLALFVFGFPFGAMMEVYTARRLSLGLIPAALMRVVTNDSFGHLWYLYMLIGIYLLLPGIKAFVDNCGRQVYKYVLAVMFVFNSVLPFISQAAGIEIAFQLPAPSCYLFYFMLGHYLDKYRPELAERLGLQIGGTALCLAVIVAACATHIISPSVVSAYSSPITVALAVCVFGLFRRITRQVSPRSWAIDRLTFGVYLIHPVLIHLLYRVLRFTPTGAAYPVKAAAIYALVTLASFAGSWILSKIPPMKKYVL